MKCSWLRSALLIALTAGCVAIKPHHLEREKSNGALPAMTGSARLVHAYTAPEKSQLFKATLDIRKHHLTGLLLIKRMATPQTGVAPPPAPPQTGRGVFRVVFANEFGMTFFDLEMQPDSFKVVSAFESLNKKALMKILETDLRLLTESGSFVAEKSYRQDGTGDRVLSGRSGSYKCWQTWSQGGDTLRCISGKSTLADKTIITFDGYSNNFPARITVKNPVIGLTLSLKAIKKE